MTMHYTQADYAYLKAKALAAGRTFDLELCSDGVMRTKEDKVRFEAKRAIADH